jgi:poly-gamma-glutamate capsule biosynthesis protein CapA/YwtB (metallophosphatase superfamily)
MEVYKDKLIIYGLGNFIFDQTHTDPTREAIYVNFNILGDRLIHVEIVPILTCGYHFGARNLANEVINGTLSYSEVDNRDEAQECVWLQPKPLNSNHPKYKTILDRVFEFTDI